MDTSVWNGHTYMEYGVTFPVYHLPKNVTLSSLAHHSQNRPQLTDLAIYKIYSTLQLIFTSFYVQVENYMNRQVNQVYSWNSNLCFPSGYVCWRTTPCSRSASLRNLAAASCLCRLPGMCRGLSPSRLPWLSRPLFQLPLAGLARPQSVSLTGEPGLADPGSWAYWHQVWPLNNSYRQGVI